MVLTLAVLVSGYSQTNQNSKKESVSGNTEQTAILQLEDAYFKSKIENNVTLMDEMLSANFSSLNQFGQVRSRAMSLTFYKTFKPRSLTLDNVKAVLVSDTTAIATGVQTENGIQFSFTHNLVRQKGKWLISSSEQKLHQFQNVAGTGSYKITGNLAGAEGMAISLIKASGIGNTNMNAAIVKDGKFQMEGRGIQYPEMVFLTTPTKRERVSFFLENSEISITGNIDSLAKAVITGSKTQDEFKGFLSSVKSINSGNAQRIKEYQAAAQAKDTVKISQLRKEMAAESQKVIEVGKAFIRNNPKSYVCPMLLADIFPRIPAEEAESLINSLDPGVSKTSTLLGLKERIIALKSLAIGKKAPDFTLNDANGNPISLYSKLGPKLLLIDFWAGWCAPCRQENPNVLKTYNEFNSKGFDIIGVSLDRTKDQWVKAIADDKLPWTQVSDLQYFNSAAARLYCINSIPANFLLDDNGIIIGSNLRGEALYKKIKELIEK